MTLLGPTDSVSSPSVPGQTLPEPSLLESQSLAGGIGRATPSRTILVAVRAMTFAKAKSEKKLGEHGQYQSIALAFGI
jgi:hypothetical protein